MKGKYMLTSKFKEEALNKLENMSTDELVDNLKFVESELDTQYLNKGDIKNQDTINNVKHGHWEESQCLDDCFWVCSCCKFPSQAIAAPKLYKYCPNCGAKMDIAEG